MFLSKRAQAVLENENFLFQHMLLANSDLYDEKENPKGYINLGTADSNLSSDILIEKLNEEGVWKFDHSLQQYFETRGILRLRTAMAKFMNHFFHPLDKIDPQNLFFFPGVASCINILAHCLADPGDVIISPTPVYPRIQPSLQQLSLVDMWPAQLTSTLREEEQFPFQLTLQRIEEEYQRATEAGKNVRGIILLNPNNPLGHVYSSEMVLDILNFCCSHRIHAIIDEVYALSVFDKNVKFKSTLTLPVPDPERTHVLYGLSKDFALAGFRVGVIYTRNNSLHTVLKEGSSFISIPSSIMKISAYLLEDLQWCETFIKENCSRLAKACQLCKNKLEKLGLPVCESVGGFCLWVDFRQP
ncbi:1-aminocyclopropane-1-carboxylate synthase-like protein 1 isoform X2 [Tachypleus tridentatus]|uniref:1-aminocyclopropane-1-carboxylate synthase-like protein 1 isoform X2 n=1 Tax=Tachypleus tridentatus TaxID=6853 RepID=UPI003FD1D1F7